MTDVFMDNDVSLVGQMVRYLRTDKVAFKLDNVLTYTGSPIGFARRVLKDNGVYLYHQYGKDIQDQFPNLPKILRDGWVYEQVFRTAVEYRMVNLFQDRPDRIATMRLEGIRAMMLVLDQSLPASKYTGFFNFKENVYQFLVSNNPIANQDRIGLTKRLIATVGSVLDPNWILHHPTWFKTLDINDELLKSLRGFLQLCTSNLYHTPETFSEVYEFDILELMDHMETFIDLRESQDTTPKMIRTFIESVEHYSRDFPVPPHYNVLYGGSYLDLLKIFSTNSQSEKPSTPNPSFFEHPLVDFINDIDKGVTVTLVNEGQLPPELIMYQFYERLIKETEAQFITLIQQVNWITPTHAIPKTKARREQLVCDHLLMVVMGLKFAKLHVEDEGSVINFIANTAHLLLHHRDETETLGLSTFSSLLPFYMKGSVQPLTPREFEIVSLVKWAWDECKFDTYKKISKSWKTHFKNPVVTAGLRNTFFSLTEVLQNDDPVDYDFVFQMSRDDFFQYLENLCEYLTTDPMTQEVEEFFNRAPNPKKNLYTTPYEFLMWVGVEDDLLVL